jgi:excinuclease UvrABC nuclease subunit
MNVADLNPASTSKVRFNLSKQKLVPAKCGCYALVTFDGTILYVGLALSLQNRFFQHRDSKEKCSPTPDGLAFWFYFIECPELEMNRIERTWQQQHVHLHGRLPIMNKIESPMT